ncbi:hypothetical protein TNCV_253941 [Trichonephila clavipes]|nr:hypothetical protein TNCV_253941 [Trichonephila clavipes]
MSSNFIEASTFPPCVAGVCYPWMSVVIEKGMLKAVFGKRKSTVESDKENVETNLRHQLFQLFGQRDDVSAHKTSSVKQCLANEFGK